MRAKWVAGLFGVVVALCAAGAPAGAQNPLFPDPEDPFRIPDDGTVRPFDDPRIGALDELDVRIRAQASGGDEIDVFGLESFDIERQYDVARRVGDDLGLPRDSYEVPEVLDFTFEDVETLPDQRLLVDDRIARPVGDGDWEIRVETDDLLRTTRVYGFSGLSLTVCPADVPVRDASSRPPDSTDGNCRTWNASPNQNGLVVAVVAEPEAEDYTRLVGILTAVALILTLMAIALAFILKRRWLRTLNGANLATILILAAASMIAAGIAALVLAVIDRPVIDFVLENDLGAWEHFLAVVLPAMLFALPGLAAAIVLTRAAPPEYGTVPAGAARVTPSGGAPGVPPWMQTPSSGPSGWQPPPQAGWQPPAQQPNWQPPAQQPPSPPPPVAPQEAEPAQQGEPAALADGETSDDRRQDPPAAPTWQAPG